MSGEPRRLSEEEIQAITERLRAGQFLDDAYQDALFRPTREALLAYAGKEPRGSILARTMGVPLQLVKRFGNGDAWANKLIFGDNLQSLKRLLELKESKELKNADGSDGFRVVYIDPPFATKREFRGRRGELAYRDRVAGAEFVEFLRKRLVFIHELLAEDGTLYLHLDSNKVHYMKILLDEIFGANNLIAEIVWKRVSGHGDAQRWSPVHETILCYSKSQTYVWNSPREPLTEGYTDSKYVHDDNDGRGRYQLDNLTSPNPRPNMTYVWQGFEPPAKGWRYSRTTMDELDAQGRIYKPEDKTKRPRLKRYLDENEGRAVDDLWTDIAPVNSQADERKGSDYPTQKPLALLERIIMASSNEGDLVLDCFSGSGTTPVAAEQLNRRWIAMDCGKLAIYTTQRRLLALRSNGKQASGLETQPFDLCHAGLYDNELVEQLDFEQFSRFALELFGARRHSHSIGGIPFAGTRKGGPVHLFPWNETDAEMGVEYIESLHERIDGKVSGAVYVVVPQAHCDQTMFRDVFELGKCVFFVMQVPYSVIAELNERDFSLVGQPASLAQVNDAIDAHGFDFIQLPEAKVKYERNGTELVAKLAEFRRGGLDPDLAAKQPDKGRGDLALVLVDSEYDGEAFRLSHYEFGEDLAGRKWTFRVPLNGGSRALVILMDVLGNELRQVIELDTIKVTK